MSDSPGLVDFAIGLVKSVLNLPDRQVNFFNRIQITEELSKQSAHQNLLGQVEMIFGLVNVGFSLPEWQAVKMTLHTASVIKI